LADNGVEQVFHKVSLKPGKPLWFGIKQESDRTKLVFGLPGNPVSSLVCFELFVRPALRALAGHKRTSLARHNALLTREHQHRGDRPTYYPARLLETDGVLRVEPLAWKGSADLATLSQANCLVHFPPGDRLYLSEKCVQVLELR
jgi:molybdopterin molybdotransferase